MCRRFAVLGGVFLCVCTCSWTDNDCSRQMSHPPDKPYDRKGWVCRYSKTQGRAYLLHVASGKSTWMVDNTDPSFVRIEQEWSIEVVAKQAGKQAAKQASRDAAN